MTVTSPRKKAGSTSGATAPQTNENNAAEAPRSRRTGLAGIRERSAAPVERTPAAENIKKLIANMKVQLGEGSAFQFAIFDKKVSGAAASSILIFATGQKPGGEMAAAVHTLLLAGTIESALPPRTEQIGNRSVEVRVVPGDLYDDWYWQEVQAKIADITGVAAVYEASANVLPADFNVENEEDVRGVLVMATQALKTVVDRFTGDDGYEFSVDDMEQNERLIGRLDLNPGIVQDSVGLPIRSDQALHVTGASPNEGQKASGQAGLTDILTVDTFMNLYYEPPRQAGRGEIQETYHYTAEAVATNIDVKIGMPTLSTMCLALNAMAYLGKQLNFAMAWRQRVAQTDPHRDLSAIGFDVPELTNRDGKPMRIPEFTSNVNNGAFLKIIETMIRPDILYSIDIPEVGPMAALSGVFEAAAYGNRAAEDEIIEACNQLTGGRFNDYFDGGKLVVARDERITLGYFVDSKGNRVDLRKLDYLMMLNIHGEQDMQTVMEFDDTWSKPEVDIAVRLARREELMFLTRPEMVITGYARRWTFTAEFMAALDAAMDATGHAINWQGGGSDLVNSGRRRPGTLSSLAVDSRRLAGVQTGRRDSSSSLSR